MARLGFVLNAPGLAVKIKDEPSGQFIASTNAEDNFPFNILDNQDGGYMVDGLGTGLYSVYVSSDQSPQEELQHHAYLGSDGVTHILDASDDGTQIWHHKIDDDGTTSKVLLSAEKILDLLSGKASTTSLGEALEAFDNHTHDAYAVTDPGDGLVAQDGSKLGVALSAEEGEDDIKLNAGKELALKKPFTSTRYINPAWNFAQLMSSLDNQLYQLQNHAGASGGFYQILHTMKFVDTTPSSLVHVEDAAHVSTPGGGVDTYVTYLNEQIHKIPQMRQMVIYFNGAINAFSGHVKLTYGGLSVESEEFSSGVGEYYAMFLDIHTLTDWVPHLLTVDFINTGGDETYIYALQLIVRDAITGNAGEQSYSVQNATE